MLPARRQSDPHQLVVGMSGLKLGDRFLQIGCAQGGRLGALAVKVGLSGHAAAAVPDDAAANRARKGAEQAGAFVEIVTGSLRMLPFEADAFGLVIVDDTDGLLGTMTSDERVGVLREVYRVLAPGGRAQVVSALPASGLGALFSRGPKTPPLDAEPLLDAAGFSLTRVLGEREELRFTEAVKRRA